MPVAYPGCHDVPAKAHLRFWVNFKHEASGACLIPLTTSRSLSLNHDFNDCPIPNRDGFSGLKDLILSIDASYIRNVKQLRVQSI